MKARSPSSGVSIGGVTVLVIFTVLCLTIFSVLSLASAQADKRLSDKNLEQAARYYEADGKAEEWLREVDAALRQASDANGNPDTAPWQTAENLLREKELPGGSFDRETKRLDYAVPVSGALSLRVALRLSFADGRFSYEIAEWRVYSTIDYAIDDSITLWDGS